MSGKKFKAGDLIDRQSEIHYAFHKGIGEITPLHDHDFFEIFLITSGKVIHKFNGNKKILDKGSLVFIRPKDIHGFEKAGKSGCELINLAFPESTVTELFEYLGKGFDTERLTEADDPPYIMLSDTEVNLTRQKLMDLNLLPRENPDKIRTASRMLLAEIMMNYFRKNDGREDSSIPEWLLELRSEMMKQKNFTSGIQNMRKLSGKSAEHLSRSFRQHFGMSPGEYINELRLNYTANLLVSTDEPVTRIALEAGYENLSYYSTLFSKKYGISPHTFRKKHRKNQIGD